MTNDMKSRDDLAALLPCAHCGGPSVKLDREPQRTNLWHVFCADCDSSGPTSETKAEAIAAWNRRADLAAPSAQQAARCVVPDGQTPLDDKLNHRFLDVIKEGGTARDAGTGSPYHGHSLEHCLHSVGWVSRDLRLALEESRSRAAPSAPVLPDLTLFDPSDSEALDWVVKHLTAIRRDNGNMDYSLTAVIRAYQAGKASAAPASRR